jgi:hypothetical protein
VFQSRVLFWRKLQKNSASAVLDRVFQHLSGFGCLHSLTSPGHLPDLVWVSEDQLPGQRRFQVGFQELNLPAMAEHKRHIDAMARSLKAGHEASIGE